MSDKKIKYTGKAEKGWYEYSYEGEDGNVYEGLTSESPSEYNRRKILDEIDKEASKITIEFEDKVYNTHQLENLYGALPQNYNLDNNEIPDIINSENLSIDELNEVKKLKNKSEASRWKSRQRSLRKKGKLKQYKIDMLNKLGMIWYPIGSMGSKDKWEQNYISFRINGLCYEIKSWVKEQRVLFESNSLNDENLFRLKAVDFPFTAKNNEEYKLTRKSCWVLREKLQKKVDKFVINKQKELSVYEKKKNFHGTKREVIELKKSNKEVNKFYNRRYSFCSEFSLKKFNEKEALEKLSKINNGISYFNTRLEEFLDFESKNCKKNSIVTRSFIRRFYDDVNNSKLTKTEIYSELSKFNVSDFNGNIRKQACIYMINHLPYISLRKGKHFKEINYLISAYKNEKNINELNNLRYLIEKYPMLEELYGEKINITILSI